MFLDHFRLREQPFGVTPDPRFLFLSQAHREALSALFYGVEAGRGFLTIIAEPGMGKTTLIVQLLERLRNSTCTAFLFQTDCSSRELLCYVASDLGIDPSGLDACALHQRLNELLARQMLAGQRTLIVVDEAQNLDESAFETLRLLSNFETPRSKLLQILLSGQPQLAEKLARPSLAQLRQRISIVARLKALTAPETARYIEHRLEVAGYDSGPLFTRGALERIALHSQGVPRNINNLCFGALSIGYALNRRQIDADIVEEVVSDLDLAALAPKPQQPVRRADASCFGQPGLSYPDVTSASVWRAALATAGVVAALLTSLFLFSTAGRVGWTAWDRVAGKGTPAIRVTMDLGPSTRPVEPILPANLNGASQAAQAPSVHSARSVASQTVQVEPQQTLRGISLRYLGAYNPRVLNQILELNPRLTDPNHIEVGQRLRLPGQPTARLDESAGDARNLSAMEKGKQP